MLNNNHPFKIPARTCSTEAEAHTGDQLDSYSKYTGWNIHRQRHHQANRASWFKFVVRNNPQISQLRPRGGNCQTKCIDEFSSFKGNFEREEQVEDTILDRSCPHLAKPNLAQNRIWPKKSEFGQVHFHDRIWPNRIWPELVFLVF